MTRNREYKYISIPIAIKEIILVIFKIPTKNIPKWF